MEKEITELLTSEEEEEELKSSVSKKSKPSVEEEEEEEDVSFVSSSAPRETFMAHERYFLRNAYSIYGYYMLPMPINLHGVGENVLWPCVNGNISMVLQNIAFGEGTEGEDILCKEGGIDKLSEQRLHFLRCKSSKRRKISSMGFTPSDQFFFIFKKGEFAYQVTIPRTKSRMMLYDEKFIEEYKKNVAPELLKYWEEAMEYFVGEYKAVQEKMQIESAKLEEEQRIVEKNKAKFAERWERHKQAEERIKEKEREERLKKLKEEEGKPLIKDIRVGMYISHRPPMSIPLLYGEGDPIIRSYVKDIIPSKDVYYDIKDGNIYPKSGYIPITSIMSTWKQEDVIYFDGQLRGVPLKDCVLHVPDMKDKARLALLEHTLKMDKLIEEINSIKHAIDKGRFDVVSISRDANIYFFEDILEYRKKYTIEELVKKGIDKVDAKNKAEELFENEAVKEDRELFAKLRSAKLREVESWRRLVEND